ncbi:hypothetical protein ARALYDRAFT_915832 [Arabidopsis lyrata subsp. lyrata]|uniref:PX domain-containing protein n=1 Tax=Arabidopsis lyrata subsp. lyrata TaxID=81972 RepID=D7MI84_ARALL|nr:hypothetical protein ARALYDRAFT_915832 [Arabidopsis lyrata subsp. lyrata]
MAVLHAVSAVLHNFSKQEFLEQRRVVLEKYSRRLYAHPVIRNSEEWKVFLQVQGKLPLPMGTNVASRMLDGVVKLPKQLFGDGRASAVPVHEVVQPLTKLENEEAVSNAQRTRANEIKNLATAAVKASRFYRVEFPDCQTFEKLGNVWEKVAEETSQYDR